jgi:hypothetical protein
MQQARNEKGQFPKGISGNPSGKTKEGLIPVQDAPVTEARELVSLVEKRESALDDIERILLEHAPALMEKAIKRAENNDKVLVVLIESLLGKIGTQRQRQPGTAPRDRDQLELELFKTMDELGINIRANNRSAPLPAPADQELKNAGPRPGYSDGDSE